MNLNFNNINVLLIGDFMIDQYVLCNSTRMSPEAPVPVLNPEEIYFTPGGAGNVAINLSELGARVTCIGTVGSDKNGKKLKNLLLQKNINVENLYETDLPTTLKKRYYLKGKQVLRVDIEEINEHWSPKNLDFDYDKYDIIVLSDYNKGVLNNQWFSKIKAKNIFVDPKKDDFSFYSNATIITPNLNELQRAANTEINNNDTLVKVCQSMIKNSNLEYILAKKGDKGISIIGRDKFVKHIDSYKVNDPDVTGAGDTVIAVFSLSFAKTNDVEKSARIANAVAALVVEKKGTAFVTLEEFKSLKNF
jgi:rfaE bifunctional protein kinase chain/domain